jgi:DNA primase
MNRKIPESFYNDLYYTDNFKQFVLSFGIEKDLYDNEKRLVIPFYDKEKNLTGFQGRALNDSKIRYITIRLKEDVPRVFGVDRIDEEKPIYVVEGPIDAMFLDNAVAVSNSNLASITQIYDKSKVILVFDNEPRNAEIVKLMDKAVDEHFNMVIWPEMIDEKDINDMILNGYTKEELHDIIEGNTYINLGAKLQLMNWKKV